MLTKEDVRPELRSGPCEKCSEQISEEESHILTFYRGRFVILHEDCADFMEHATKGPRGQSPHAPRAAPIGPNGPTS